MLLTTPRMISMVVIGFILGVWFYYRVLKPIWKSLEMWKDR